MPTESSNEFQMLMDRLERIENNQRDMSVKLDKLVESDSNIKERLAKLEAKQERYVTFKMLVTTGLTSGGAAIGLGGLAGHLITRIAG